MSGVGRRLASKQAVWKVKEETEERKLYIKLHGERRPVPNRDLWNEHRPRLCRYAQCRRVFTLVDAACQVGGLCCEDTDTDPLVRRQWLLGTMESYPRYWTLSTISKMFTVFAHIDFLQQTKYYCSYYAIILHITGAVEMSPATFAADLSRALVACPSCSKALHLRAQPEQYRRCCEISARQPPLSRLMLH